MTTQPVHDAIECFISLVFSNKLEIGVDVAPLALLQECETILETFFKYWTASLNYTFEKRERNILSLCIGTLLKLCG